MADEIIDIGAPSICAIERPRESKPFVPDRDNHSDRIHQANEELNRKVDHLATELSALKPRINNDVRRCTRACLKCQITKFPCNIVHPLGTFTPTDSWLSHLDLTPGPRRPFARIAKEAVVRSVDETILSGRVFHRVVKLRRPVTWRPEALRLTDITAESVARGLVTLWISRYAVPKTIIMERCRQFYYALIHTFSRILVVNQIKTTAYLSMSNDMD
ncbi:hypothetical protein MRX96_037966 [Rhipicephalus microplus]